MKGRKLEIGSGNRPLEGYEHLDIDPNCPNLDFCCSMDEIPVEDNTFEEIVSIHCLEHISWRDSLKTLQEWYRILKPKGFVKIEVPNLRWICEAYLENGKQWTRDFRTMHREEQEKLKVKGFYCHTLWANFKIFSSTRNGDIHLAGFDCFLLGSLMEEAGFDSVKVVKDHNVLIMTGKK